MSRGNEIAEPIQAPHVPIEGVAGYIVLTETHGVWKDDWDGEVHTTLRDGYDELEEARNACHAAILVQCIRCPERASGFTESTKSARG